MLNFPWNGEEVEFLFINDGNEFKFNINFFEQDDEKFIPVSRSVIYVNREMETKLKKAAAELLEQFRNLKPYRLTIFTGIHQINEKTIDVGFNRKIKRMLALI